MLEYYQLWPPSYQYKAVTTQDNAQLFPPRWCSTISAYGSLGHYDPYGVMDGTLLASHLHDRLPLPAGPPSPARVNQQLCKQPCCTGHQATAVHPPASCHSLLLHTRHNTLITLGHYNPCRSACADFRQHLSDLAWLSLSQTRWWLPARGRSRPPSSHIDSIWIHPWIRLK